jgi:DNA/RNA-binding domain of Phe-tRNA-synthetase-like protein
MVIGIMISSKIRNILPGIQLGCINAEVNVQPSARELLDYMDQIVKEVKASLNIDQVSRVKVIAETKDAYRKLGKDPSRYRPSAEALIRRVVQGKGLYRVNNIVDALNIISVKHGFSIGGYDRNNINWPVELGIGLAGEPYTAIGRGELNIEHMPVLRDESGAFGSPTSDSQRTMVKNNTHAFMMVFFDFQPSGELDKVMKDAVDILREFCGAKKIETNRYT